MTVSPCFGPGGVTVSPYLGMTISPWITAPVPGVIHSLGVCKGGMTVSPYGCLLLPEELSHLVGGHGGAACREHDDAAGGIFKA